MPPKASHIVNSRYALLVWSYFPNMLTARIRFFEHLKSSRDKVL